MKPLLLVSIIAAIGIGIILSILGFSHYQSLYVQNCEADGGFMTGFLSCTKIWTDFTTEEAMLIDRYKDTPEVEAFYAKYDDADVSVKDGYLSYFAGNKTDFRIRMNLYFDDNFVVTNEDLLCYVGNNPPYDVPQEDILYYLENYHCLTYKSGDPLKKN